MSDIFREVDEALSKEKAAKFWKDFGPTLLLAAIVLIASTGITTAWRAWNSTQNQKETAKLVLAAEDKNIAAAMEKAAEGTRDNQKAVALLNAAAREAEAGNFAKAADLYGQVADDHAAPDDLQDLAVIMNVRAVLLSAGASPDYKALTQKLLPVAQNKKSAFQLQAKLDTALLYGDGLKDYTRALDLLKDGFTAEGTADSLKEKAAALKHVYEYEIEK